MEYKARGSVLKKAVVKFPYSLGSQASLSSVHHCLRKTLKVTVFASGFTLRIPSISNANWIRTGADALLYVGKASLLYPIKSSERRTSL